MKSQIERLQQTIEILKTIPSQRAEIQISYLQQETNNIELFKSYKEEGGDNELQRLCCTQMKYEFFKKDQTVFNIDDFGTKFYIIISGKVGVYIRMPKHKKQEAILQSNGEVHFTEEDPLQMVKELKIGDSFGELALLKNSKRLASIICQEDCHFGIIDKKTFNLALKEKEEEKLEVQMKFLANSPLFCKLPKSTIRILYMNSFHVCFKKNQPVYLEGQNTNACFIVKSGEFTIYKTIDHVLEPFEKKNQYLAGGEGHKTLELKICVLSKGQIFGEIELFSGETRQTSAYCTSLDGGELMIINRADLEQKVFNEDVYKAQFEKYAYIKEQQLKKRIEGIKNQLIKYKNYRFMTSALKNEQVDVCEQIKNKQFNYSLNDLDDVFQTSNFSQNEQQGQFSAQQTPQQRSSFKSEFKQKRNSIKNICEQQNIQEDQQNNEILTQQIQTGRRSIKLESLDDKQQNLTSHITKNGKEQMISKFLVSNESNNEQQKQDKKEKILRVELSSYSNLKNSIKKMTAIALSKQYRQPYQKFMNASSIYDISMSEKTMKNQQQQPQQLPKYLQNNEDKMVMSHSNIRRKSMTSTQHDKTHRRNQLSALNDTSLKDIKSQTSICHQTLFRKTISKGVISNQTIQDIKVPEENECISHQNLNKKHNIRSYINMGSSINKNKMFESLGDIDTIEKFNEMTQSIELKSLKNQQLQDINLVDSIKNESQSIQEEDFIKISIQANQENNNYSSSEENITQNEAQLKDILKINISAGKDHNSDNYSTCSTNLNTSKRGSLISSSNLSSKKCLKNTPTNSNQTKNGSIFQYPLKSAKIQFEKYCKNSQKNPHFRLHNKDQSLKSPCSQTSRSLSQLLSPKKVISDGENHPYFISTFTFLNDQHDIQSKIASVGKKTSIHNIFTFTSTPHNRNITDFLSSRKQSISNMNNNKMFGKEDKKEDKDLSQINKDETQKNILHIKKQNLQTQQGFKSNTCSQFDLNQILPLKSSDNKQNSQNKIKQYQRHIRKTSDCTLNHLQLENINHEQPVIRHSSSTINFLKRKQNSEIFPLYKFQLEQPYTIKKQIPEPSITNLKIIHQQQS